MKSPRLNVTVQTIAEQNTNPHTHNDKYGIKIANMDGIVIYSNHSNQTIDKNDQNDQNVGRIKAGGSQIFQESETVERKAIVVEDIKKEIIAFANCKGGKLYIGVQDDGTVSGLDNPDETSLQISNMVRDAIKPDLTMFLHYETITVGDKKIVAVDIQQGTERPYYIAKKGLRPEGVYVRQGYSSVPATNTAIRRMIKETDGDYFEEMRSLEQNLTFESAKKFLLNEM